MSYLSNWYLHNAEIAMAGIEYYRMSLNISEKDGIHYVATEPEKFGYFVTIIPANVEDWIEKTYKIHCDKGAELIWC